jgi:hypothetical protein
MSQLSAISVLTLYFLTGLFGLYFLLLWWWEIKVLQGRAMKNPDGSSDDWREQKIHYGMALADVVLACPLALVGTVLVFLGSRWGVLIMALEAYFFVWVNLVTTATSLRFMRPKLDFTWIMVFPFGSILGLVYLIWVVIHFRVVFCL